MTRLGFYTAEEMHAACVRWACWGLVVGAAFGAVVVACSMWGLR